MTELESLVENSLYQTIHTLDDGKSIVMDVPTGILYFKKTLSVYNIAVFSYLKMHPDRHIPRIHTFWENEDKLVVIEEFIQGKTLEEVLTEKNPPFEEKKHILLEICDGLEILHQADPPIIHRDLKASNIMLTEDGIVKIIDYDAAKVYDQSRKKDTVLIGTHGIAAPEQYGFAQSDARTDIYALGKLIERMLPDNADAAQIIEKATQMEPDKRYSSVAQMRRQIEKIREKQPKQKNLLKRLPGYNSKKKTVRITTWIFTAAVAALICAAVYHYVLYPEYKVRQPAYNRGVQALEEGNFELALEEFSICGIGYRDTAERITQVKISRIDVKLDALEELSSDGVYDKKVSALDDLFASCKYGDFSEDQKKQLENIIEQYSVYYLEHGEPSNVFRIKEIMRKSGFGEAEVWDDLYTMINAQSNLKPENCSDKLDKMAELSNRNVESAKERLDAMIKQCITIAAEKEDAFYQADEMSYTARNAARDAIRIYNALEPYEKTSVSKKEALLQRVREKIQQKVSEKDYTEAERYADVLILGEESGAEELLKDLQYQDAQYCAEKGDYQSAISAFEKLSDYKDAADQALACRYLTAEQLLGEKQYEEAVNAFTKLGDYSDSAKRALEAEYEYCVSQKNDPDDLAEAYIKTLVSSHYEGAEELNNYMHTWRAEITWGADSKIGWIETAYIRAMLSGGPKDGNTHVHFVVTVTETGQVIEYTTEQAVKRGEYGAMTVYNNNAESHVFGSSFSVEVYDDEGNLLGSKSGVIEG